MTHEEYHNDTSRVSKSGLDKLDQSAAHYYAAYLDPNRERRDETAAMFEGTALHTAILERNEFNKRYILLPKNAPSMDCLRHRNAAKPSPDTLKNIKWWDEFNVQRKDRLIIKNDLYNEVQKISDSVFRHPAANWLLSNKATVEGYIQWDDIETGVPCKCRPDFDITDKNSPPLFVDLKSTINASPDGFSKSVVNYRYDIQAAFYLDGAAANFKPRDGFIFIAVEKEPPYAVGVYNLPDEMLQVAHARYIENLNTYKKAKETGIWPAYADQVLDIKIPKYYFTKLKQI